ncbi:MAG: histidinol dehydrogenase [Phycisphaerae bacterium]
MTWSIPPAILSLLEDGPAGAVPRQAVEGGREGTTFPAAEATMSSISIIRTDQTDAARELRAIRQSLLLDQLILGDAPESQTVLDIIRDVRARGDEAVAQITARVDNVNVPPESVRVPVEEIKKARERLAPDVRQAVRHAIASVRRFQQSVLACLTEPTAPDGQQLSIRMKPIRRVGICVPGAAAPLPSSAIHCAVPAQVAGVRELALVAPPRHGGEIHPTILAVAGELGISEVYRMGGAQAVAALAIGTQRVGRVDKIVGPGSVYVQLAKRWLYGVVDIDMFAGPSEVVILADESARPEFVALDMLAQAEHDPGCAILLTPCAALADAVVAEIDRQLSQLPAPDGARRALATLGAIVLVRDMKEAVALANDIAPEHLQIATDNAAALAAEIDSAGAIFLGHYTPEAVGDYVAGPSHVLPTGGSARFWSGVSALDFLRRTSMIEYTPGGLVHDAASIETLARAEGLEAHARSVSIRTRRRV